MSAGAVDDWERYVIPKLPNLIKLLRPSLLMDHLRARKLIVREDYNRLREMSTEEDRSRALLHDYLPNRPRAFDQFCEVLRVVEGHECALREIVPEGVATSPPSVRKRRKSDTLPTENIAAKATRLGETDMRATFIFEAKYEQEVRRQDAALKKMCLEVFGIDSSDVKVLFNRRGSHSEVTAQAEHPCWCSEIKLISLTLYGVSKDLVIDNRENLIDCVTGYLQEANVYVTRKSIRFVEAVEGSTFVVMEMDFQAYFTLFCVLGQEGKIYKLGLLLQSTFSGLTKTMLYVGGLPAVTLLDDKLKDVSPTDPINLKLESVEKGKEVTYFQESVMVGKIFPEAKGDKYFGKVPSKGDGMSDGHKISDSVQERKELSLQASTVEEQVKAAQQTEDVSQEEQSPARAFHESILLNNKKFIWGGQNESLGLHSRLELFSVNMLTGEWNEHNVTPPDTPPPSERSCSATIENTIYSYGGRISAPMTMCDELYKLSLDEMRWRKVQGKGTKPPGLYAAGMCTMNDKLLLMGGYGPSSSKALPMFPIDYTWKNDFFEFYPETEQWSPLHVLGPKPCPRCDHTLTGIEDKGAVVFGGFDGRKRLNDMWLYEYEKKVWSAITPSSALWPQPRSAHTMCTMVCDNNEIKLLLMGGHGKNVVLDDCWLFDVNRGISEKIMFDGEPLKRYGHSTVCMTLMDGTVIISVFGGCTETSPNSAVGNPRFFTWDPRNPTVLHCGLESAGPALHPNEPTGIVVNTDPPVSATSISVAQGTSEKIERIEEEIALLTQNSEEHQGRIDHLHAQLTEERCMADENVKKLTEAKDKLNKELRKLNDDKESLIITLRCESEEQMKALDQIKAEKGEMQRKVKEMEELLTNAEAASEAAERRLRDSKQLLIIPDEDVEITNKELGSGSFGGVRVGYWRGCQVAVKMLHKELSKERYQRRLFEQEASIYAGLHHPNIAAICGVIEEADGPFSLVMELLQASLADVIEAAHINGKYLTLREKTDVSHDCLSGLTYLHGLPRPVLHGDIRPTNILMTSVMTAKLGDLGAARFTDGSLSVGPMSPMYVAPERLLDRTLPNTKEADVYSMGVSLCELFTGDQMDRQDRPRQVRTVDQRDLRIVCVKMTSEKVQERIMASEALAVNDRVLKTKDYSSCGPRRMVRGVVDGADKVTLCDKPW